ncbi:hypothetical protein RJ640_000660 [Escallonia rubra]|uniref:Myb/SANT-like domain-containing protein n=1 Tax=Escallonia rubra TaxID=112253 RepID=A0AA88UI07_9ASTE|nr:hypothetical protein RJ640_000660 [Escallonia rubra]
MDEYLLDVLLDQKNNGQKPDRNFSHAAYDVAVKAMNERFTVRVNKDKVTNRLKTLKKKMDIGVEVFRRGSGFGWNDITKQIEAPPEITLLARNSPCLQKRRLFETKYLSQPVTGILCPPLFLRVDIIPPVIESRV